MIPIIHFMILSYLGFPLSCSSYQSCQKKERFWGKHFSAAG